MIYLPSVGVLALLLRLYLFCSSLIAINQLVKTLHHQHHDGLLCPFLTFTHNIRKDKKRLNANKVHFCLTDTIYLTMQTMPNINGVH